MEEKEDNDNKDIITIDDVKKEKNFFKKMLNKISSIFNKKNKSDNIQNSDIVLNQEIKEKKKKKDKINIDIGSKAVIKNAKFYKKLDKRDEYETLENSKNEELQITHFAVIDELGKKTKCIFDKSISEYKKENPNAKLMIYVATRKKIIGWMEYDSVKEKFETKAKNDLKKQQNGFKENLQNNAKSQNLTFNERLNNIKNEEEQEKVEER